MKNLLLLFLFALGLNTVAQKSGDIVVYSNTGEKFYVVLNGIRQNTNAETNVKVTGLTNPWYGCKIIAGNNSFELEKNLPVKMDTLVTYQITGKKGKYKLRFYSETPLRTAPTTSGQTVVIYSPTGTTTSTGTGTTTTVGNTGTTTTVGNTGTTGTTGTTTTIGTTGTTTTVGTTGTTTTVGTTGTTTTVGTTGTTTTAGTTGTGTNENVNISINVSENGMNMNVSGTETGTTGGTTTTTGGTGTTTSSHTSSSTTTGGNGTTTYYEETTTTTTTTTTGGNNTMYTDPNMTVTMTTTGTGTGTTSGTSTGTTTSTGGTNTNYYSGNCTMSDSDFAALKKSVQAESFAEDQLRVANMAAKNKCMSVAQIKAILGLFAFSSEQLSFAKTAYDNCSNKNDYYQVMEIFTFSEDKEELEKYINSK